ncbi:hypothetical protein HJG60_009196 [Phyllostomus discolor]|uniref:Uncharacterized protein n=1 Tax=Phyllostomus discolor TaxID=89673 RepID=A0A834DHC6_9CHIR|nr:hypothetical protein HJG60_009196 [Phyllostomus discolor]
MRPDTLLRSSLPPPALQGSIAHSASCFSGIRPPHQGPRAKCRPPCRQHARQVGEAAFLTRAPGNAPATRAAPCPLPAAQTPTASSFLGVRGFSPRGAVSARSVCKAYAAVVTLPSRATAAPVPPHCPDSPGSPGQGPRVQGAGAPRGPPGPRWRLQSTALCSLSTLSADKPRATRTAQ